MKYYSTNNKIPKLSFREAVLQGLAPDKGLYVPEHYPRFEASFFKDIESCSLQEVASLVLEKYLEESLSFSEIREIVRSSFSIDVPVKQLHDNIFSMELFHGPTGAFKDFGASFMAACMERFLLNSPRETLVLVATSGDTGGAVARAFYQKEGIRVVLLYPKNMVSGFQKRQLTSLGANITAVELNASFDTCQTFVKRAFADKELNERYTLSSANSINIARLLPQSIYYYYAYAQSHPDGKDVYISVPSGNFGNLTAGLMAKKTGLPVKKFIASNNLNNVFFEYLNSANFSPRPSVTTLSNAMDVGNPSNFYRILELYSGDFENIRKDILGAFYTDEQTIEVMKEVYRKYQYKLDPHGAVAYMGMKKYLNDEGIGIFLETAHPCKFSDTVFRATGVMSDVPEYLTKAFREHESFIEMPDDFFNLKSFLLDSE